MKKCSNPDVRRTYGIDEAAAMLGISRASAYEAAHAGEIPSIRIGGRILVPREPFDRMLEGDEKKSA